MSVNSFYDAGFDCAGLEDRPARAGDTEYRTRFQIDRDRIIHSSAFRRLQKKTQVFHTFIDAQHDTSRTRLTHSLEVAQIGRAICGWLKKHSPLLNAAEHVDGDLVEAACLAHDLGHPPFGHTGERKLHELMAGYGGFEGNAQTLRLLTRLMFAESRKGTNPSRALIDAILKYKTLHREANGADHHYLYDDQESILLFVLDAATLPPPVERDDLRSIECQIMDWADDTAYSLNDLSDAIQAGLITIPKLEAWAAKQNLGEDAHAHISFILSAIKDGKVESRIGALIGTHIRACSLRERTNSLSTKTRRHALELVVDESVRARAELHKRIATDLVFHTPDLQQHDFKAGLVLEQLFNVLHERYIDPRKHRRLHLLPNETEDEIERASDASSRARIVCDWLASLTDRGAFLMHQRLFDTRLAGE